MQYTISFSHLVGHDPICNAEKHVTSSLMKLSNFLIATKSEERLASLETPKNLAQQYNLDQSGQAQLRYVGGMCVTKAKHH